VAGSTSQVSLKFDAGAQVVAFVASTGKGASNVALKVESEFEVDVAEATVHGEEWRFVFEEGSHLAGIAYQATLPAPSEDEEELRDSLGDFHGDARSMKEARHEAFKQCIKKVKNACRVIHHLGSPEVVQEHSETVGAGQLSALSQLQPETMLELLDGVYLSEVDHPTFKRTLTEAMVLDGAMPVSEIFESARERSSSLRLGQGGTLMDEVVPTNAATARSPELSSWDTAADGSPLLQGVSPQSNRTPSPVLSVGNSPLLGPAATAKETPKTRAANFERMKGFSHSHGTSALDKYEWRLDNDTRRRAFEAVDVQGDGQIMVDEVVRFLIQLDPEDRPKAMKKSNPWSKSGRADIKTALAALDEDGDGFVSFEELYGFEENSTAKSPEPLHTDVLGLSRTMSLRAW